MISRRPLWYVLRDRIAMPCDDPQQAMLERGDPARSRVAESTIGDGACWVSTVFLGLDHNYGQGDPLLFETMAFTPQPDKPDAWGTPTGMRRYSSWSEADWGHADLVRRLSAEYEDSHLVTADLLARCAFTN
jgi:hypothetical protein